MRQIPRRAIGIATACALATVTMSGVVYASGHRSDASSNRHWPYATASRSTARTAVLSAVGDVACEPDDEENTGNPSALKCGSEDLGGFPAQYATADQVERMHPDLVALLGDEQYEVGKLTDFEQSFDKTFGAFKFLQRPAPGNHEYYPYVKHGDNEAGQNGAGYFAYYNGKDAKGSIRPHGQAGDYNKGWYSYDLGKWHVVSLNAECDSDAFGHNCDPTTGVLGQETHWLAGDLAANHSRCTLAYWHQPTFSSTGSTGDDPYASFGSNEGGAADAWWKLLYRDRADLVLNGHEHLYARFRPQDPSGAVDTKRGLRQFIIGTGGEDLDTLAPAADLKTAHVVTGEDTAYGAMKLQLAQHGYHWSFEPSYAPSSAPTSAMDYADAGSARCH